MELTMQELLEAGVHFGHQTQKWDPRMKPFIFAKRRGIHIINLEQTVPLFKEACEFITELVAAGGQVLFVGTKRQAQPVIEEQAKRCNMFFVSNRWLGGTLTNFKTIKASIDRLCHLVAEHEFIFEEKKIPITVSIGLATLKASNYKDIDALIKAADHNLYESKHKGRNRVTADP